MADLKLPTPKPKPEFLLHKNLEEEIKELLNLLNIRQKTGGPPPSPAQVQKGLEHQDAAKKAKEFFSNKAVKLAMKSDWVAKKLDNQIQKYLKANPEMAAAIKTGLKNNPALCKEIRQNVKGTAMEKIANRFLPKPTPTAKASPSSPKPTPSSSKAKKTASTTATKIAVKGAKVALKTAGPHGQAKAKKTASTTTSKKSAVKGAKVALKTAGPHGQAKAKTTASTTASRIPVKGAKVTIITAGPHGQAIVKTAKVTGVYKVTNATMSSPKGRHNLEAIAAKACEAAANAREKRRPSQPTPSPAPEERSSMGPKR